MLIMTAGLLTMLSLADSAWMVVDDTVMGGRSVGHTEPLTDGIRFAGVLSLENNGGFSSTRVRVEERPVGMVGIRMWIRGDGRTYQARLRQNEGLDGVAWRASFNTTANWRQITMRFAEFEPVFRGTPVRGAGTIDPANIRQLGFLLADKKAGAFWLEVRDLEFLTEGE